MVNYILGDFLAEFFMFIYFVAVISLVIYIIRLFTRLVNAIEKIADSVEDCCKSKTY